MSRNKCLLVALAFCLCAGLASAGEVVRIGGLAALQLGFGKSMNTGAQLAVDEINAAGGVLGSKFELVWYDSEHSPAIGRTQTQRLIFNDKVQYIVGCHASTVVLAIEKLVAQNNVLNVAMGSAQKLTELNNPWITRVRENDFLTTDVIANYMIGEKKHEKIACIYMSDQYGMGCRDNLIDVLKKKNMTLVASEAHNLQDKDFTSQILNVKKSGATAVVMVSGVPALGIMVKQARQLMPEVEIYTTSIGATGPFVDVAGEAAKGVYAICTYIRDNPNPVVQKFVKAYTDKYNEPPQDFFAALAYDAVYLIKQAMLNANSTTDREKIRDEFKKIQDFPGGTGLKYNGSPNGEMVHELLLITYDENVKQKVLATVKGE